MPSERGPSYPHESEGLSDPSQHEIYFSVGLNSMKSDRWRTLNDLFAVDTLSKV